MAILLGLSAPGATGQSASDIAVPAHRQANNVAVITVNGEINDVMAKSIHRRIQLAARAGAQALVFQIDSPGGELRSALQISTLIKQSPVANTVGWIKSEALSGGALIALACREVIVDDPVTFGDIKPVRVTMEGLNRVVQGLTPDQQRKILPVIVADALDSARRFNRFSNEYIYDEQLLTAMIADDVELWRVRHVDTGQEICIDRGEFEVLFPGQPTAGTPRLASARVEPNKTTPLSVAAAGTGPTAEPAKPGHEFAAPSPTLTPLAAEIGRAQNLPSSRPAISARDRGRWVLLEKVTDGKGPVVFTSDDLAKYRLAANTTSAGAERRVVPIRTDDDLRAFFGAKTVRRLDASWSEGMVNFLTEPVVRGVLIVIFILGLFVEMVSPGMVLPGLFSALSLVMLLAPPLLIGMANWWEVAAIGVGVVLLLLELLVIPGFGVPGILGLVLVFAGLLGTFVPAGSGGLFPDSAQGTSGLLTGLAVLVISAGTAGAGIYFISKHFASLPILEKLVLKTPGVDDEEDGDSLLASMATDDLGAPARPGDIGIALTPLRPAGRMQSGDRIIDVVCEVGYIPAGARVRVVDVTEFRVSVERADGAAPLDEGSARA